MSVGQVHLVLCWYGRYTIGIEDSGPVWCDVCWTGGLCGCGVYWVGVVCTGWVWCIMDRYGIDVYWMGVEGVKGVSEPNLCNQVSQEGVDANLVQTGSRKYTSTLCPWKSSSSLWPSGCSPG